MKSKTLFVTLIITFIIALTSCASSPKPPRERDETFIADIDNFGVESIHLYASYGMNKPKVSDFTIIFAPRSNYIYIQGKIGIDVVKLGFSYNERLKLKSAKEKYIELYNSGNITKAKPTKKNALSTGDVFIAWGTLGPSHAADTTYFTNIQYILDNKPYFRILAEQAPESDGSGNSSPRVNLYISPSQWESIIEACNQERLEAMTDEILAEANAF